MHLLQQIQDQLRQALTGYIASVDAAVALVKPTQDAKHGDYQANCAMSLARQLGKKPRDVAQEIVQRLPSSDMLHAPEIAGPGFINFRFQKDWLARQLQTMAADERLGIQPAAQPRTVVIDFSSPNVAKPLHVGHLRSTIIGDSLARLLRFLGHHVITDNHLGDWGTQFGMIIYGYKNFLDEEALQRDPVQELARLYRLVREQIKPAEADKEERTKKKYTDEQLILAQKVQEAARQETAKLHAGDPENLRLWQMFMPWCMAEIEAIYKRLAVHFDHTQGESFYNPYLPAVVEDLRNKGVAEASDGALVIFFGENEPPAIVQKTDGAFTYTTTDLATIQYRVQQWHPDEILYVVDFRQALHFKNLFIAAQRWGYDKVGLKHISFGSVLGEDGKPLSTREGTGTLLEELLASAVAAAARNYRETRQERLERGEEVPELSDEELRPLEEIVGLGAVKYADLSQNRTSDYVFSLSKMLAMNGNTATYMQYAYVRNRGIFRKGGVETADYRTAPPLPILDTDAERALALALLRFEEALSNAAAEYQPSEITAYLWDLSRCYSTFFVNCPVLKAETETLRESRLLLCDLTGRVIQKGLAVLGIQTVERM